VPRDAAILNNIFYVKVECATSPHLHLLDAYLNIMLLICSVMMLDLSKRLENPRKRQQPL
jgi:hypothetical protein